MNQDSRRYVRKTVLIALAVLLVVCDPIRAGQLVAGEVWVNPGAGGGADHDLHQFMSTVTSAFVGTLLQVAPAFVDQAREHLYTRMTFQVTETIKGPLPYSSPSIGVIDVWTAGGTYLNTSEGRQARGPADIAATLRIGESYFVPAALDQPTSGVPDFLVLVGRDAFTRIDGSQAIPVIDSKEWVTNVINIGRQGSPSPNVNDAAAFLEAIRRAALP